MGLTVFLKILCTFVSLHWIKQNQASVSWWSWPPLPRYQGTGIASNHRTYPAAHFFGSNLFSPFFARTETQKYVPWPLCFYTKYIPDRRLYYDSAFCSIPRTKRELGLSLLQIKLKKVWVSWSPGNKDGCVLKILHTTARILIFHKISSGLEK